MDSNIEISAGDGPAHGQVSTLALPLSGTEEEWPWQDCGIGVFYNHPPKNITFSSYSQTRIPLLESESSAEQFQHTTGPKYRCIEEGKKNSFTLSMSLLSGSKCQEKTPQPTLSVTEKSESIVNECLASLAVQDIAQEAQIFLAPTRVQMWAAQVRGLERWEHKTGAQNSSKSHGSFTNSIKEQPWAAWDTSPMNSTYWCTGTSNALYASPTAGVTPQLAREDFADGSQAHVESQFNSASMEKGIQTWTFHGIAVG